MESPLGRSILMTGGAGFLGRAIIDRATREEWDTRITVYSRDEEKQYRVKMRWPHVRCVLGDITDTARLTESLDGHETILHLAAHKFVPEAEHAVTIAINANVNGTMAAANAATMARVQNAVFVSTDKACMPRNVYGFTKALGERIWSERFSNARHTRFRAVRYGNVIGSTGSVLPIFVSKIKSGQQIQLTDPQMTRFYMSVDRAIDTIVAAYRSDYFMTVPVMKAADLITTMEAAANIAGRAEKTIAYTVVGDRGGEKVHEQLISSAEAYLVRDYNATPSNDFLHLTTETDRETEFPYNDDPDLYALNSYDASQMSSSELADVYRATEGI